MREQGFQIARPVENDAEDVALGLDRWRELPRAQTPPWADPAQVAEVCTVLDTVPSVVAPYEVDQLRRRLALVCEGKAFLLQGGDCAETFADNTESHLLANARTLLQMASCSPTARRCRWSRWPGWPASTPSPGRCPPTRAACSAYRGDMINSLETTPRRGSPTRSA